MFQWSLAGGLRLLLSSGPVSGPGGASPAHIRSEMSCSPLGNEGKEYGESSPLQESESRLYGVRSLGRRGET